MSDDTRIPPKGGSSGAPPRGKIIPDRVRKALVSLLSEMLDDAGYISDSDECECGEYGTGFDGPDKTGKPCVHIRAHRAITEAEQK